MWNPKQARGKQRATSIVCHAIWQSRRLSSCAGLPFGHGQVCSLCWSLSSTRLEFFGWGSCLSASDLGWQSCRDSWALFPKESLHISACISSVNLKDSFVVGHLSAVKMWNRCLRHDSLDFCSYVPVSFISVWCFLTITTEISSLFLCFPILMAEILIVCWHEVFCNHFRSKPLAFFPMYNDVWTINVIYRSYKWSPFVEEQWQQLISRRAAVFYDACLPCTEMSWKLAYRSDYKGVPLAETILHNVSVHTVCKWNPSGTVFWNRSFAFLKKTQTWL